MRISATVRHAPDHHEVTVTTEGSSATLDVPATEQGHGSARNGGELLAVALATCFVNDLYREAAQQDLTVDGVSVTVDSEYGGPGEPARSLTYMVRVDSAEDPAAIADLVRRTDALAEVHNTLRVGTPVTLVEATPDSR